MEVKDKKEEPVYSETAYDDAFRTMEGRCDDLLIPFVSHMFGEQYDKTAVVKRLRNEHYVEHEDGSKEKRITDSFFDITYKDVTKRYHLECESKAYDGTILVRIFEYGTQIAIDTGEKSSYKARFVFPESGVLVLRSSKETPEKAVIEIIMPNGKEVSYDVPLIKISDYSIEDISKEYLKIPFDKRSDVFGKNSIKEAETSKIADYACKAAFICKAATPLIREKLVKSGMENLFYNIEMPLSYILYAMEKEGIIAKKDELKAYSDKLAVRIAELEKAIYEAAGCEFNINSPKQLGEVLFEKLGLPAEKKTKSGYSTAADVLEKLGSPAISIPKRES